MYQVFLWYLGYLLIDIKGMNQERFINLCANHNIRLWDLKYYGTGYQSKITLRDYRKLHPLARKCRVVPKIRQRYGFPFYLYQGRKRITLFLGILLFGFFVFWASGCLWNISFEGSYQHTEEQMFSCITNLGIHAGMRLSDIDCGDLETKIRSIYTDIGWVSAELKGTHLIIKIKETNQPAAFTSTKKTNLQVGHIVAGRDGIVTDIVTRRGKAMVKAGDVVHKGQILISGILEVVGDNEETLRKYPVLADGNITLKTYYQYEDQFAQEYKVKIKTGRKKTGYEVFGFGSKIFSYNPSNSYESCDIIAEVKGARLFGSFYLPFTLTKIRMEEFLYREAIYTETEMKKIAEQKISHFIKKLAEKEGIVLSKELETKVVSGSCITSGRIVAEEPAWKYKKITEKEWRSTVVDEYIRNDD